MPDDVVVERISGRDQGREDDNPETVRERLRVYHGETEPLVAYYERARPAAARRREGDPDAVSERIRAELRGRLRKGWLVRSSVAALAAALCLAAAMPAAAAAQAVGCGAVLSADSDADGGCHRLPGQRPRHRRAGHHGRPRRAHRRRAGRPGGDPEQVGIDDSAGYDDVTIRNGAVTHFEHGGVRLAGVEDARVERLDIELTITSGILVESGARNVIRDNDLAYPEPARHHRPRRRAPDRDHRQPRREPRERRHRARGRSGRGDGHRRQRGGGSTRG